MNYKKQTLVLITIATLVRLVFSCFSGLGADEAYYWTYALRPQWNYFDHPPIVAWMIRLSTINLLLHHEFFIRLGAVISCAICTWLIFKLGTMVKDCYTGWLAALLYTGSIYCSITAGTYILPDSPQLIFWIGSIITLLKISRSDDKTDADLLWCLFGLLTGLCIMSKVHGLFLWLGAALYICITDRRWLRSRGVYLSAAITLVTISPIIWWNITNHFITYRFHSSRVSVIGTGLNFPAFLKSIGGEVAIHNPVNFFLIFSCLFLTFRNKVAMKEKELRIILFTSLPLIIAVLFISLFQETFAHWPGPAYSTLLILPAAKLASVPKKGKYHIPQIIKWALAYLLFVGLVQVLTINHFPGTLSVQKQGPKTGAGDLTLDMFDWKEAGMQFDTIYRSDIKNKKMTTGVPIIITNWSPAATIEYYIAAKTQQEIIGIGSIFDLHQYYWTNKYKKPLKKGDDAYYIVPSDTFYYRTTAEVFGSFDHHDPPLMITQYRDGIICRYLSVYRMRSFLGRHDVILK